MLLEANVSEKPGYSIKWIDKEVQGFTPKAVSSLKGNPENRVEAFGKRSGD